MVIHGNFIGAAIVVIINLILLDTGVFGRQIPKTPLIVLNVVLDALIIILLAFAFK